MTLTLAMVTFRSPRGTPLTAGTGLMFLSRHRSYQPIHQTRCLPSKEAGTYRLPGGLSLSPSAAPDLSPWKSSNLGPDCIEAPHNILLICGGSGPPDNVSHQKCMTAPALRASVGFLSARLISSFPGQAGDDRANCGG